MNIAKRKSFSTGDRVESGAASSGLSRRVLNRQWLVVAIAAVVIFGATLVSVGYGIDQRLTGCSGVLRAVAWLLTLPMNMANPGDIRRAVLPVGVGLLLVIGGILSLKRGETTPVSRPDGAGAFWVGLKTFAFAWLLCLLVSILSSIYNDTWLLSRGWTLSLFASGVWAIVLACICSPKSGRILVNGMMALGAGACVVTLWHRQETNLLYVDWPIGPLTISAAIAAVVAVLAGGRLLVIFLAGATGQTRRWGSVFLHCVAFAVALGVLFVCARTGPWLALAAGVGFVAAVAILKKYPKRSVKLAIVSAIAAGFLMVGGYVWWVASSSQSAKARSVGIRFVYWGQIVRELPHSWALGVGPEMFSSRMTSLLVRERAEMPHFIHGYVDTEAHNEWLQAIYELGVVGGLAYLAIPILAIAVAVKGWWKSVTASPPVVQMSLPIAGAIVVIFIMESASINLRHPVLSAWYWTLIGLAFVPATRVPSEQEKAVGSGFLRPVGSMLSVMAGLAFLIATFVDCRRSMLHAEGMETLQNDPSQAVRTLASARGRLGAAQWFQVEYDYGLALSKWAEGIGATPTSQMSVSSSTTSRWQSAVKQWRELDRISPAYLDTGSNFAKALYLSGDLGGCVARLKRQLTEFNPYDPLANLLFLHFANPSASERLACIQHGLREADIDQDFAAAIQTAVKDDEFRRMLDAAVRDAEAELSRGEPQAWHDSLAPETLRIAAFLDAEAGNVDPASKRQHAAAECYRRLRLTNAPARRRVFAETDAAWKEAFYLFQAHPDVYPRCFEIICEAERIFANEMARDVLRVTDAELGYVGGEVMLSEMPPRFASMWRFSAAMHLLQGRWKAAAIRATYALPPERRTGSDIIGEQKAMAEWLVNVFASQPVSQRPAAYDTLRQFGTNAP